MFTLENILNYTSANIQIIGVFIAIIGGLIATKLLNKRVAIPFDVFLSTKHL